MLLHTGIVGRDDLSAPCMPTLSGRECGLRGRTAGKRGTTKGFPPLVNHPLSFRARFARKGK